MASAKEKVKEFLGLDKDFTTHTEKDNEAVVVPPVEAAVAIPAAEPVLADTSVSKDTKQHAVAGAGADPCDKKLDHFQYTKDPKELDYWEFNENVNPLTVDKKVEKEYPEFTWHWRSKARIDRLGMDYMGWEKFTDKSLGYVDGMKRGNDLILFCMPKERAQRYRNKVASESTGRVKELQEQQMELTDRAVRAGLQPYEPKGSGTGGIAVGERARGQSRGLSQEEVRERIVKRQEDRNRGRVTFDMGRR